MSLKTTESSTPVDVFLASIKDEQRRADCIQLDKLLSELTGEKGKMWGSAIVGYGKYSYTRSDNKTYEFLAIGFSPRVQNLTIYNLPGYTAHPKLMNKLGTYSTGKSCLYIKRLSDINIEILKEILSDGFHSVVGKHLDYKTGTWSNSP